MSQEGTHCPFLLGTTLLYLEYRRLHQRLGITEFLTLGGMEGTDVCVSLWNRDRTLGSHLDHLHVDMSSLVPTAQACF